MTRQSIKFEKGVLNSILSCRKQAGSRQCKTSIKAKRDYKKKKSQTWYRQYQHKTGTINSVVSGVKWKRKVENILVKK